MADTEFSANTAKPKGKPRGKPFTGNDDQRNNRNGQRSREVVATAAQARELYVKVLHEPITTTTIDPAMSNLESIVRQHVKSAKGGDAFAREAMFDRIWGKSLQQLEMTATIEHKVNGSLKLEDLRKLPADELVERYRQSLDESRESAP